jgi:hypothetical protein
MKVWTISLCFNDPQIIRQSIASYYATKDPRVETVHLLVDQHWPIGYAKLRTELESIARDYRCILLDPGLNLGLHRGFNWAWGQFNIPDNAGIIGFDPDCIPTTPGWDMKMCELFCAKDDAAWISLMNPRTLSEVKARMDIEVRLGGHFAFRMKHPTVNSICMFRQRWLRECGGILENNPFYGTLEMAMFPKLGKNFWYIMRDVYESDGNRDQENHLYREWKWRTCHEHTIPVTKDFATWLREAHPEVL